MIEKMLKDLKRLETKSKRGSKEMSRRWMWQDAGRYAGLIGAGLARLNPTRWSPMRSVAPRTQAEKSLKSH